MTNNVFYTIIIDNKFLNSNFMRDNTDHILEGVRFYTEGDAKDFTENFRKDISFKVVKVSCTFEEVEIVD